MFGTVAGQKEAASAQDRAKGFVLGPAVERRLREQGTLDLGTGHPVDVRSPRARARTEDERQRAYGWHPGDLRISLETLEKRYDPEVFQEFEKYAKKADVGEGITLMDWLEGQTVSDAPYRAFQTDAYAVKFANKKLEPITQRLPEAQKQAGAGYQRGGSQLNKILRASRGGKLPKNLEKMKNMLDKAMEQSPLPESMVLWRHTRLPEDVDLRQGDIFQEKAFLSTSLSKPASLKFDGNTVFEIRAAKGAPGVFLGELDKEHGREREVLMPRGTQLKILAVEERKDYRYIRAEVVL